MNTSDSHPKSMRDDMHLAPSGTAAVGRAAPPDVGRDLWKPSMGIGALLVSASMVVTILGAPMAFAITALAWGGILMALAQYFRHRAAERLMAAHREAQRLEHERERWGHQQAQLEHLLAHGLPPGFPIEDVRALIAPGNRDSSRAHALPEPEDVVAPKQ